MERTGDTGHGSAGRAAQGSRKRRVKNVQYINHVLRAVHIYAAPAVNGFVSSRGGAKMLEIDLWFHCPAKIRSTLCKGDSIERRRCVVGIGSGRSCLRPKTGLWASAEARNTVFCAETATEWASVRLPRETWSSTRRRQTRGKGQGNITSLCSSRRPRSRRDTWCGCVAERPYVAIWLPYATSWPVTERPA